MNTNFVSNLFSQGSIEQEHLSKNIKSFSFWGVYTLHCTLFSSYFIITKAFLKRTVLFAQKHLQRSHSFMVNVLILQFDNSICSFFFLSGFSFTNIQDPQDSRRRGWLSVICPLLHIYPLRRHINISRVTTAESSPLHVASSRTRTWNLWLPSTSH